MNNIQLSESGSSVIILDQSLLPNEEKYTELKTPEEMFEAISELRVRGAPAIGIFAGYAMAALAHQQVKYKPISSCCGAAGASDEVFLREMQKQGEYLKSSRPTAVNLVWAIDRVINAAKVEMFRARQDEPTRISINAGAKRLADKMRNEALAIHEEDKKMCRSIAQNGLGLLRPGCGILTHCNAGPLATSEYGTALGPILLGKEQGINFRVFADETRPLLQGARLTAYELMRADVDVTLICDNMAAMVMKNRWVQAVLVGCDRIAKNGDVANKIGTSGVAILAKHYNIPFYVLGPSSTIDTNCMTGEEIPIEERDADEIGKKFYAKPMAPKGVNCFNPSFDITENELITAIITEKGIFKPPYNFKRTDP